MVPVAAGPVMAIVPVSSSVVRIMPLSRLDTVVSGQQLVPIIVAPGIIPGIALQGSYGTHALPQTIAPETFAAIIPSAEMPLSTNQFLGVSVTQATLPFVNSDAFVNIMPSIEMPAPTQFIGATGASIAHNAASFEGVKNELIAPNIIGPSAFASITPSVILDIPGAARYFEGASEAFDTSK
jgi:hypothetical protein